jgi:uncharacterized protein YdaT
MPWTLERYPASFKNLPPRVRFKAIEIANALLAAGRPEGQAIRIAIGSARRWGAAHAARSASARRQRGCLSHPHGAASRAP